MKPDEVEYLYIPGYVAPQAVALAAAPKLEPSLPSTPPEYTQSLLDWLNERLQSPVGGLR
jgi:hypothetical protein